jgi:hypothetical protein
MDDHAARRAIAVGLHSPDVEAAADGLRPQSLAVHVVAEARHDERLETESPQVAGDV